MSVNNREMGYSCDIALKQVVELYASSSEFKRDLHDINMQPELIQYRRKQLIKGRRREPVVAQLIKNKNHYTRLTKEWKHDWRVLLKIIPDNVRLKVKQMAEKWGLRCDWGCGFIMSNIHSLYQMRATLTVESSEGTLTGEMNLSPFMLSPGPPNSMAHLTTEINVSDTDYSIKQKLADLKTRAKRFREITKKHLATLDYRGFEKRKKRT